MTSTLTWILAGIGTIALMGVFIRMKPGFGPFNLRAVGLIVVVTMASVLALQSSASLTATMGILGAVAGYLFGLKDSDN